MRFSQYSAESAASSDEGDFDGDASVDDMALGGDILHAPSAIAAITRRAPSCPCVRDPMAEQATLRRFTISAN
jgi:hypothetical protein